MHKIINRMAKVTAVLMGILVMAGCGNTSEKEIIRTEDYHYDLFGENVFVFSPEDDPAEVKKILDELWKKQETNQFGDERYSVYFLPGDYDESISVKVGYYMQVAGLGYLPGDTNITSLNCDARWLGDDSNHNATCNFWRGVENLTIESNTMWAVSQATFMRRVHVKGALYLHDNYGWASGGFLADSVIDLATDSGSQQQWLSRNCDWKAWLGDNWNMVFAGIEEGKAPVGTWPAKQYTEVDTVEEIREKPFLVYDEEKGFGVFVQDTRLNSKGVSWYKEGECIKKEELDGKFLPISEFYVAKAEKDNEETLNAALQAGKNIFFTPGVYELKEELLVENPETILLGSGLATLRAMAGNECIHVKTSGEVTVAGLLMDAGTVESQLLMQLGEESEKENSENDEASLLADLFFRVGGALSEPAKADVCAEINNSNVIGDNFWIWRADHGEQVGWDLNTARTGLIVNGSDVTIYALMVEHFQEYQTVWRGENGKVIMYQSEIPYDVPNQSVYMSHDGTVNGYASYKVDEEVNTHEIWGFGIYSYNRDAVIEIHSAVELPSKEGVLAHHVCAVMITGNPGISYIINEIGEHCYTDGARAIIKEYGAEGGT